MHIKIKSPKSRDITAIIQYGLILVLYICHGTWFYVVNDMFFRILIIAISIGAYAACYNRIREKNLTLLLGYLFLTMILCEIVFSGIGQIKFAFYNFLFIIEPLLIGIVSYKYDKEHFCDRFVKTVLFFALISLTFYFLCLVYSHILIQNGILKKQELRRLTYTDFYCNFLYAYRDKEVFRNVGSFSEPGVYQIVLNGAIYIIAFYPEKVLIKHKKLALTIFILTLITTQSTTGILGLMVIFIGILFSKRKHVNKHIRNIICAFTILMVVYVFYTLIRYSTDSLVYREIIEKLIGIGSNRLSTGSVRFQTISLMANMIIHNPIGYGFSYVSNQIELLAPNAVGARILVTTAAIGIVPVAVLLFYFIRRAYVNKKSMAQFWALIFLYINTALAQSKDIYPIFVALMLLENIIERNVEQ